MTDTNAETAIKTTTTIDRDRARLRARLRADVLTCRACALRDLCRRPVPFSAPTPPSPPLLTVCGESPGKNEDRLGAPFVGRAGQLLDRWLDSVGVTRARAFLCNAVSCAPFEDGSKRDPTEDELVACRPLFLRQIRLARSPAVLVVSRFLHPTFGVRRRGELVDWTDPDDPSYSAKVLATYHPSYVLRDRGGKGQSQVEVDRHLAVLYAYLNSILVRDLEALFPGACQVWPTPNEVLEAAREFRDLGSSRSSAEFARLKAMDLLRTGTERMSVQDRARVVRVRTDMLVAEVLARRSELRGWRAVLGLRKTKKGDRP